MKRLMITLLLFCAAAGLLYAEDALVAYAAGYVDVKDTAGKRYAVNIGDYLVPGETVITGKNGVAELEQGRASVIKISPNTVFTILESGSGGGSKETVMSCTVGSASFKFAKVLGKEPKISTPSLTAGIRGTAFVVFAGADGSSLILVENGLVEVSAEGGSVELNPDEGVEVKPGEQPGEKFKVLWGQIDYSQWNDEREAEFLKDPVTGIIRIRKRLQWFYENIAAENKAFLEKQDLLVKERATLKEIKEKEGEQAWTDYYNNTVYPLEIEAGHRFLNVRYFTLSSLSFRRYVLGKMYAVMKATYILDRENKAYAQFLNIYGAILEEFEQSAVPHLVEADI